MGRRDSALVRNGSPKIEEPFRWGINVGRMATAPKRDAQFQNEWCLTQGPAFAAGPYFLGCAVRWVAAPLPRVLFISPPSQTPPLRYPRAVFSAPADSPQPVPCPFEKDGTLSAASPILEARAGHACVAFQDRTLLVAGGATNSAEVFHPDTHSWTVTGTTNRLPFMFRVGIRDEI
jgi:Kelch motif